MKAYRIENNNKKNYEICLTKTTKKPKNARLKIIARNVYNLYINNRFVSYGPARAAEGYARMDDIPIDGYLSDNENVITIYFLNVGAKTLCFPDGEPYLGCELVSDEVSFEAEDFDCYLMNDRIDKVERMSLQRGYVEVYKQSADRRFFKDCVVAELVEVKPPRLLNRGVSFSLNESVVAKAIENGSVTFDSDKQWNACLVSCLSDCADGSFYPLKDCETVLFRELEKMNYHRGGRGKFGYVLYDFGKTYCGKIKITISVENDADLWVTYDDLLIGGKVDFGREQIVHGLKWSLKKGEYTLYSVEVYAMRYISLVSDCDLSNATVSLIKIENPAERSEKFLDNELQKIYDAAQNTFKQNSYDLLTDCPSRERAGWLCDSYFSAKAERFFTGDNVVERNFLENYLLYDGNEFENDGILPMCYPSEPKNQNDFIPNWILWFIVELDDFLKRTDDGAFVGRFTAKIRKILSYFKEFENEFGLLENCRGWVFIEWSKANDFDAGVNFPSNMLYCEALRCAGRILNDNEPADKADRLKKTIIDFAFDGEYFYDNAVRINGKLERTDNISETCQIYACFFNMTTKQENTEYYKRFFKRFKSDETLKTVYPANMFMGYVMRLMVLLREGEYRLLLGECKQAFLGMAERTGTIWELFSENASCNHGFGSIVAQIIFDADRRYRHN